MKIRLNIISAATAVILLTASQLMAQSSFSMQTFQSERIAINKSGMFVLGSWAIGNILLGAYGNQKATGEAKYAHQFNAMWNLVNFGIAAFGYVNAATADPSAMSNAEILKEFGALQNFLLLNAGLDVAYMATAVYLKERAKSSANGERLRGYGNSLLFQGAFLLVFDSALYLVHENNASIRLYPHFGNLISGGVGVGISWNF
jgi:hypothetical protein